MAGIRRRTPGGREEDVDMEEPLLGKLDFEQDPADLDSFDQDAPFDDDVFDDLEDDFDDDGVMVGDGFDRSLYGDDGIDDLEELDDMDDFDDMDPMDLDGFEEDDRRGMSGTLLVLAGVVFGLAVAAGGAYYFLFSEQGMPVAGGGNLPVVTADSETYKETPEDPGGLRLDNQDREVYERLENEGTTSAPTTAQTPTLTRDEEEVESLLPPPEQTASPASDGDSMADGQAGSMMADNASGSAASSAGAPDTMSGTTAGASTEPADTSTTMAANAPEAPAAPDSGPSASSGTGAVEVPPPRSTTTPATDAANGSDATGTPPAAPQLTVGPSSSTPATTTASAAPAPSGTGTPSTPAAAPVEKPPASPSAQTAAAPATQAPASATGAPRPLVSGPGTGSAPVASTGPRPAATSGGGSGGGGGPQIQLGALGSEAGARQAWARISKGNADLMGGLSAQIVRFVRDDGVTFYRLRAGPLGSRAEAVTLCGQLKVRGQACFVP
ncbi:MAG: SPOR domain-containing protein [Rhodospirillaceae bacterium]